MPTKPPKPRDVRPSKSPPSAQSATLTRAEVAAILQCSEASVRRMEGEALHPTADPSGKRWFDPVEVAGVAKERSRRAIDPTKEGERDARAFELLDAGHGIRDVVTRLRLPAEVAKRLADVWREAGGRDVVLTASCKTELTQCLGHFRDAAELVQRVRAASAESERVYEEHTQLQNRLDSLVVLLGELAARLPALEQALPEVKAKLDAESVESLERAQAVFSQRRAAVEPAAPPREVAVPSESGAAAGKRNETPCAPTAPAPRDGTPTGVPTTASVAPGLANSETTPLADSRSPRERLLDAWLVSLVAEEARLQRLGALLNRDEVEMFARLEGGIGGTVAVAAATGDPGSSRERLLDELLVSIADDDARLEAIGALLTSQELDMLVELGRGLPECDVPSARNAPSTP